MRSNGRAFQRTFLLVMSDDPNAIPLADVLRAANELVAAGLIEDYALGGALAAIYYVEPFTTYDADIIFVAADKGLTAGIPAIYAHLQKHGWRVEHEHLLVCGSLFSFSLLSASPKKLRTSVRIGVSPFFLHSLPRADVILIFR